MAGLRGQVREPRGGARARRNSQNLVSSVQFIAPSPDSVVVIDGDGYLQLNLGNGLANTAGALVIDLASNSGLAFNSGNLTIDLDGNTLALGANGISVVTANLAAAGAVDKGVVNIAAAVADLSQTITDPPTQAEVQAISDKIDELLASLRTAGILAT